MGENSETALDRPLNADRAVNDFQSLLRRRRDGHRQTEDILPRGGSRTQGQQVPNGALEGAVRIVDVGGIQRAQLRHIALQGELAQDEGMERGELGFVG